MKTFRSLLFYPGYIFLTGWFSVTGLLFFSFLPLRVRSLYLITWNRLIMVWLRISCGIRYRIEGEIPDGLYVIAAKHQSQWETFFLQWAFFPVSVVLKQELLNLPFFGWALRLVAPISIDRGNPKAALRKINEEGLDRLNRGLRVLIFPEGTRTPPGQRGKYARSVSNLALLAGVPIVPVAHNAGEFWPSKQFIKHPGVITVVIGQPIATEGADSRQLTAQIEQWIEDQQARISTL